MSHMHSVTLDRSKCVGCTNCLKHCPTEAIRVHGGRAHIIAERCIDCGECIRQCQHHAKVAVTDPLAAINRYPYKIALPAPALYGQFKRLPSLSSVARGLIMMGFDEVYDVARGADLVSMAVRARLQEADCPKPLISSSCPAVVRLIQIRFPELIGNIADLRSPMEMAAVSARREFCEKNGVSPEDVGCFFITPCAAKMTAIRRPLGHAASAVSGAISLQEIFGLLSTNIRKSAEPDAEDSDPFRATGLGLGWARSGGEALASGIDSALAVDGIDHVAQVLEEIENNRLPDLTFFEGLACVGGCVGGPLTLENCFIARNRIRDLAERLPRATGEDQAARAEYAALKDSLRFDREILPIRAMQLDADLQKALAMMDQIEEIRQKLPGLDCGSCGSPTCQALAEDIVRGYAHENDCPIMLKECVRQMARQMVSLSEGTRA